MAQGRAHRGDSPQDAVSQGGQRPWERQPAETPQAYHAFCHYRDLPPSDRSVERAYAQCLTDCARRAGPRTAAIADQWREWSRQHWWVNRVMARDARQDAAERLKRLKHMRAMHERHAALAVAFLNKLVERIQALDPETLSADELAQWLNTASALERRARSEVAEYVAEIQEEAGGER
jgi:hypothetical protein